MAFRVGKIAIGSWGRPGLIIDLHGREEFGRIHTYAVLRYAEGDTETLSVDELGVW